jgi:HTH-type transcriptional regulator, competence development regulator
MDTPTFGQTIKALREKKGMNLRAFAKALEKSPTFISRLERDEDVRPSEETVKEMARLLGADVNELLAMAGRVSSDIQEIIRKHPKELAAFLRTADNKNLQPEDWEKLTQNLNKES